MIVLVIKKKQIIHRKHNVELISATPIDRIIRIYFHTTLENRLTQDVFVYHCFILNFVLNACAPVIDMQTKWASNSGFTIKAKKT